MLSNGPKNHCSSHDIGSSQHKPWTSLPWLIHDEKLAYILCGPPLWKENHPCGELHKPVLAKPDSSITEPLIALMDLQEFFKRFALSP